MNIGDGVTVKILDVKSNQVRLGITAPKNVPVDREDERIKIEKGKAGEATLKSCAERA